MRFCGKIRGIIIFVVCLAAFSKMVFAQGITDLKREIYSKVGDSFCKTTPLNKCDCPAAKEMKAYIDALIETGTNKEEIFYKVAKRFTLNAILDKEVKADVEKRLGREFGQKRPRISLEFTSFDFGKVNRKQSPLRKNIKLYNKGDADLVIKKIKAACSCTTVALSVGKDKSPYFGNKGSEPGWQMVIGPNKSGELEFVLDLSSFPKIGISSKLSRHILLTTNDPVYPQVEVMGSAEIIE